MKARCTEEEKKLKHKAYVKFWGQNNSEKIKGYAARYRATHQEQIKQARKTRDKNNPEVARRAKLRREYNLTPEAYQTLWESQKGLCPICKADLTTVRKDIDHDHENGAVRAILCHGCNAGIGFFKEKTLSLLAAVDYLEALR